MFTGFADKSVEKGGDCNRLVLFAAKLVNGWKRTQPGITDHYQEPLIAI
jgi:hypothetical protein